MTRYVMEGEPKTFSPSAIQIINESTIIMSHDSGFSIAAIQSETYAQFTWHRYLLLLI